MQYVSRLAYNSADWQKPTGEARKYETVGTYNHENGFGHEDWLFRSDWIIAGWRYAFIQGVNKSHARLVKEKMPFDLTLYTIEPDKRRQYIAKIHAVECLDKQQAQDALEEFKKRGWYDLMLQEIRDVNGNEGKLGSWEWAQYILNVRFRMENVIRFPPHSYVGANDPFQKRWRYQLYKDDAHDQASFVANGKLHSGSTSPPEITSYLRKGCAPAQCSPEHARMQAKLMAELRAEYPDAEIVREQNFIDVSVRSKRELLLFEIKSDLDPRTVIRLALGQILEYAFHPNRKHELPLRLVIVGRRPLSKLDQEYLSRLKQEFRLPLEYRVLEL